MKKDAIYSEMKKKFQEIKKEDVFLVTITSWDEKNNGLGTSLFMYKFHFNDLDETKKVIIDLIENAKKELLK